MECGYLHPFPEIKPMRLHALRSGIQRESSAPILVGESDQPVEELVAMPQGAGRRVRHEVVNVQGLAGKKKIVDSKSRNGADGVVDFEVGELKSFLSHSTNPGYKVISAEVRPKLGKDGKASGDVAIGVG
jgi:hypothetical protein